MEPLTVCDFFCGAGGFSEGFRQQGFEIVLGIDHWSAATNTFNHNFGLSCTPHDVLDFEKSIEKIEALPDTDIILGSPPCVTFSSSNNSGKADKTLGITLMKVFLKIVAVKKWKRDSKLKAWFMENVPRSLRHLEDYTFKDLGLSEWAAKNDLVESAVAISLKQNASIINSANHGAPQTRERMIAGEIICEKKFVIPNYSHAEKNEKLLAWRNANEVLKALPKPNCKKSYRRINDPNYPSLSLPMNTITDHFYDSGLYAWEWRQSKFLKTNHPYMGKMSFPENGNRPSRTITATKSGSSREASIYRSEYLRKGDGEYRTPTVREAACLMGFPLSYQFLGTEGQKWTLVGNAVCPSVSRALAETVRRSYQLPDISAPVIQMVPNLNHVGNLNTFEEKRFNKRSARTKNSRFRRHPFKDGGITVTLSNYDIETKSKDTSTWMTSVQYGTGEGFPTYRFPDDFFSEIAPIIKQLDKGSRFLEIINNGFTEKIAKGDLMQNMYESHKSMRPYCEPALLVERVAKIIDSLNVQGTVFLQDRSLVFKNKTSVPVKQLFALYALNKISSLANK